MKKLRGPILAAVGSVGLAVGLLAAIPAQAAVQDPAASVGTTAAAWTPQITSTDATVRQLVQCGSTMYAVGSFTKVQQAGKTYTRDNAFSFSATTGTLTSWNPAPNGIVNSIALTANCSTAYLGGRFSSISGRTVRDIVAVSTKDGHVFTSFARNASAEVYTVALVNSGKELMVGGNFTSINGTAKQSYASLDYRTGKVDSYFAAALTGQLPGTGSRKVFNQQLSPQGNRLLLEGNFTAIGGVTHLQAAELDLTSTHATLDPWSNAMLNSTYCYKTEELYVRSGAFSPDGSTIYLPATGFQGTSPYCDAVSAFANTPAATVEWINKTGGDSLYAVAASDTDVYIGGHERWANNPQGSNTCGTGCLSRPGLGDISPTTGLATSWNPTRDRGHGADDLLLTPAGLWVASDTFYGAAKCAGTYHPGICFLPADQAS